jgi:hypothetical protein
LIVDWLRRALLELWAMFVIAAAVGFLGPFGTYLNSTLAERVEQWWQLLMGAYLFVRPWIIGLRWLAHLTWLPSRVLVSWGVIATSVPLAMLWRQVGQDAFRELEGYAALIPFALLCALAVWAVEVWADRANDRLRSQRAYEADAERAMPRFPEHQEQGVSAAPLPSAEAIRPKLFDRLSPTFRGPVIALQSEDHYVRVHGMSGSELVLLRLRDAIAEMAGVAGEQVHRSWWVSCDGVASLGQVGRSWVVHLRNGETAPVARDSVPRLQRSGFLPAPSSS